MKIRHVYDDLHGEVEGMFDEEGKLLGTWCCNDANWRNEYFDTFIKSLGHEVVSSSDRKLVSKLRKVWKD